ncbi:MAG: WxL domain surface cell wall-binding [Thermomicrobiales bacterium]|jgi:hypothetical protein|nr:WxL domain surface cell wall-binding [Thermomicrobiales bacterium]
MAFSLKTRALGLIGAAALSLTMVAPALAVDTVSLAVTPGSRSASVADLTLTSVAYSHAVQAQTGSMTLTANDATGSGAGWNVTILSSAFAYTGTNGGTAIPAVNFSLASAAAPAMTAGQAVDATGTDVAPTGPQLGALAGVSGTLETARKVLRAGAAYGQGTYTQGLNVSLSIPAQSRAGTYTGTLTTTIAAAP